MVVDFIAICLTTAPCKTEVRYLGDVTPAFLSSRLNS